MQRFKKILFVNEPGSSAKTTPQRAAQLARNNGAQLTLCDVSPVLPRTLSNLHTAYKGCIRANRDFQVVGPPCDRRSFDKSDRRHRA